MERVFLVVIVRKGRKERAVADILEEMGELVYSSRGNVVESMVVNLDRPSPHCYLRQGKLEEIKKRLSIVRAQVLITNVELSPVQARNMGEFLNMKIVDRTGLILDIFAQHAKSKDGKIQVELAQLTYLLPRLSMIWEKFSRLGGGIGTRGPGEQILEYDRRKIRNRIATLSRDLDKLKTHRALVRKSRQRKEFFIVSIVGYTNAGKSTLLRSLTGANVLVEDKLFATLDPVTRKCVLPNGKNVLLTDTVGFLFDLPHSLIKAFHPTLEEINEADLVLMIVDGSNPQYGLHLSVVRKTLEDIEAHTKEHILVFNKMDAVSPEQRTVLEHEYPQALFISARSGEGLQQLVSRIEKEMGREHTHCIISEKG